LAQAIRCPDALIDGLGLPDELRQPAFAAARRFPLMVTQSFLRRMEYGNPDDPLLKQVLPIGAELNHVEGFVTDAVDDSVARKTPGLLHKYHGRALLIATGTCAINCRYCFRRSYPYGQEPRRLDDWTAALDYLAGDSSITEIILSGGDPLMLTDRRLDELIGRLESISHLARLRIHSRLPIVLPNRVTRQFVERLRNSRLTPVMVVHANHPHEIVDDCQVALRDLVRSGITTLNQAVLLRGINDSADVLTELSNRLMNVGVMPYYLHQLDRVTGTAHFEVPDDVALGLIRDMRTRLPGYGVPQLTRENPGAESKAPVEG
jgi:EF-P beta-lysylation protein EpmB